MHWLATQPIPLPLLREALGEGRDERHFHQWYDFVIDFWTCHKVNNSLSLSMSIIVLGGRQYMSKSLLIYCSSQPSMVHWLSSSIFPFCVFCSNKILIYFPMCVSHRRDIASFLDNLIVHTLTNLVTKTTLTTKATLTTWTNWTANKRQATTNDKQWQTTNNNHLDTWTTWTALTNWTTLTILTDQWLIKR